MIAVLFLALPHPSIASNCQVEKSDKTIVITQVYDGDSVKSSTGEKVRLIGVNTTEMNYKKGMPQAFAKKAKRFLQTKILNKKVSLSLGKEKSDRYGRTLAHIFTLAGENVQQSLLANGLAFHVIIPPNLKYKNCYQAAEKLAKSKNVGLWANKISHPTLINEKYNSETGFQSIQGKVKQIIRNKSNIKLKLAENFSLRIDKKNLPYFDSIQINQLRNKQIVVRGWISSFKNQFQMRVRHPETIQILK